MNTLLLLLACASSDPGPADPVDTVETVDSVDPVDTEDVVDTVDSVDTDPPVDLPTVALADASRDILSADLNVDIAVSEAVTRLTLAPSPSMGATFEVGDLDVHSVTWQGHALPFVDQGLTMDVGVPASTAPIELVFSYGFNTDNDESGVDALGFTLIWPYACGRLYPCHSDPADGLQFTLNLTNVPAGKVAIYPHSIPTDAPPYMVAWAFADYEQLDLGVTAAGTHVSAWYPAPLADAAVLGTAHLREAFEWLETNIGPYRFGDEVGGVAVYWGAGALGGMEHHPFWHVATGVFDVEETQVHEAAHGWFGDGVRLACWEDLTLSEGTATYLAARVLDVVAPEVGAQTWAEYRRYLSYVPPRDPVLPDTCGVVNIFRDNLWNDAVYYRGAYFYRGVAGQVGAEALDQALAAFYQRYAGQPARMQDMLDTIFVETGYDPTECADMWLRSPVIPEPGTCP